MGVSGSSTWISILLLSPPLLLALLAGPASASCDSAYRKAVTQIILDNVGPSAVEVPVSKLSAPTRFEVDRENRIRDLATQALQGIGLEAGSTIELSVTAAPDSASLRIESADISPSELLELSRKLTADPAFSTLVYEQPRTKIPKRIEISLRGSAHGQAEVSSFRFVSPSKERKEVEFGTSEYSGKPSAIAWKSSTGIHAMARAKRRKLANPQILSDYEPQRYTTLCGIASSCIILRSRGKGVLLKDGTPISQENLVEASSPVKPTEVAKGLEGNTPGYSLDDLDQILRRQGARTSLHHADLPQEQGANALRARIRSSFSEGKRIIVNFHGRTLGSQTGGHFSPIGAYDPIRDLVLVMDTAGHKNPPFWVPVEDLYHAMTKIDSEGGRTRGYIVVGEID